MRHLFPVLRERSRRRAPTPDDSEGEADGKWVEQYQAKRRRFGLISGAWTVPAASVVRLIAPGIDRVCKLITLQAGTSNTGVIYIAGNGQPSVNSSLGLTKTSAPLVLADCLVGDIAALGTVQGDVLTWVGSGTPESATGEED